MAFELVYTSAPEGLRRGSSGFCVVACTKGLGPRLVVTLEGLSAYKPLYAHYAENAWDNPISRSHYLYDQAGEKLHILSRVCFNGVDHTQRSNKLASHIVLNAKESQRAQGGPADLLGHEDLFKNASWQIHAEEYPLQLQIPPTTAPLKKCALWESVTGDAGWGGFLIDKYLAHPERSIYIAYAPEQHAMLLPLLQEALALLPEAKRWEVTFNTYFVTLPAGMQCAIRCCIAGSEALVAARRSPLNTIVDFTHLPALPLAGKYVDAARSGIAPESSPDADAVHPVIRRVVSESKQSDREQRRLNDLSPAANADATNDKNPDKTGVPTTRKRTFNRILVVALLFLVVIASLGFGGWTWHRLRQLQDQRNEICRRYITMKQNYDLLRQSIPQKPVRTEELRHYVEELRSRQQLLLEMEHAAGNLRSQQKFSDDETIQIAIIQLSNLIAQCNALSNELQKKIDDAERNLNALRQQEEKEVQQNLLGNAPETTAEKTSSKEKDRTDTPSTFPATPDPNGSPPKPQKTPDVILSGPPEYLWREGIKTTPQRKSFGVDIPGSGGRIFLTGWDESFPIADGKWGGDSVIDEYSNHIEGTVRQQNGILVIEKKGNGVLNKGIVIERDGKSYPLCFVVGVSKIKSEATPTFSLDFTDFGYEISFSKGSCDWPDAYYLKKDSCYTTCTPKIKLKKPGILDKDVSIMDGAEKVVIPVEDKALKQIVKKQKIFKDKLSPKEKIDEYKKEFPDDKESIKEIAKVREGFENKQQEIESGLETVKKYFRDKAPNHKIEGIKNWGSETCWDYAKKHGREPKGWCDTYQDVEARNTKMAKWCEDMKKKQDKACEDHKEKIRKELAELELVLVVKKEYPQGIIMRLGTKK